jgi:YbbR domain-containing protein
MKTKYDSKIFSIKEGIEIDKINHDEVNGIIIIYEMRIVDVESKRKEVAFKTTRKEKKAFSMKDMVEIIRSMSEETNEEEENFIKRLRKGIGKYEGKMPFKYFECGKVGHFFSKCPYKKEKKNKTRRG